MMGPTRSNGNTTVRPCSVAKESVPDGLRMVIDPLLPPEPNGGRPRVPDRAALAGTIYLFESGIPWGMLPKALSFGSGGTCWGQLRLLTAPKPHCGPALAPNYGSNTRPERRSGAFSDGFPTAFSEVRLCPVC